MKTKEFQIDAADNEILANLLGVFDKNLRVIEQALGIEIKNRGNIFTPISFFPKKDATVYPVL